MSAAPDKCRLIYICTSVTEVACSFHFLRIIILFSFLVLQPAPPPQEPTTVPPPSSRQSRASSTSSNTSVGSHKGRKSEAPKPKKRKRVSSNSQVLECTDP